MAVALMVLPTSSPAAAQADLPSDFGLAVKPAPNDLPGSKTTLHLKVKNIRTWTATSVQACATVSPKLGKVVGITDGGAIRFGNKSACWIVRRIKPRHTVSLAFDVAPTRRGARGATLKVGARASGGNSNPASGRFSVDLGSRKQGQADPHKHGKAGSHRQSAPTAHGRIGAAVSDTTACVAPRTLGVVFATDDSGSMEISDPAHLRAQAIAVGLDQMPDGSLAAATSFSDFSSELFGVTSVSAASRPGLKAAAKDLFDEGNTDYDEAFAGAREKLQEMSGADRKAVVFLSDGLPTNSDFDPTAPIDSAGAPVYTIGLGIDGDPEAGSVLGHLAANSGGQFYDATSAGQLQAIFARIMSTLTCGAQSVTETFTLAPGASKSIPFSVEPEDSEFRALAAWSFGNVTVTAQRPDATTMTPGALQPGESFVNESTYALLTGTTPQIGGWQLTVTANQGNSNDVSVSIDVFKKALPVPPPPPPAKGRQLDPCISAYPDIHQSSSKIFGGHEEKYDRAASLYQVCAGFGAPEGLNFSPEMKCALVAAAATFGGPALSVRADLACDTVAIATAFHSGDWLGAAAGKACGYFGEALAGAAGIVAAGATAESGPGAGAIGLYTYRALSAGMKVACGGLFAGGAAALGTKLEADHETHVAHDVTRKGRCIVYRERFHQVSWGATACS